MKKILLAIAVVLCLLMVLGFAYVFISKKNNAPGTSGAVTLPGSDTTLPSTDGNSPRFSIKGANGKELLVQNFLARADTKEDPDNNGYYILGYQPNQSAPYLISYIAGTTFFNIALLQEPIGSSRLKVEAYLTEILGLSRDELCSLNYSVSVPNSVSSNYSGMNLGFSSCPGSIKLP